jgi:hypothetical protein
LIGNAYSVHGVSIHVLCEDQLDLPISSYLNSLYRGEKRSDIKPLEFELYIVEEPPPVPISSVQAFKTPSVTSYSDDKVIYFTSADGSIICLNPNTRDARGFVKKEILSDSMKLASLVGVSLTEALKYDGFYFLHSAALYSNGIGLLISGDGGCGKTTTSLGLVRAGFRYVSDDSVFFEDLNGEIVICPLYTSFHIDRDLIERFPEVTLRKNLHIPEGIKVSVDVSQSFPGSFIPYIRPNVIIFPKISSKGESQLHPISQMEVYMRLLKQIVLVSDKVISKNQLKALEKLVKQTVGYELLSGRDIYEDPKKLINLIYQVSGRNEDSDILHSIV